VAARVERSATSTNSAFDKLSRRIANKRLVKPDKINQAIGRLKERYPRVARYYNLSHDRQTASLTPTFDPDKHAKAERLDGCYLLKTNRKDPATLRWQDGTAASWGGEGGGCGQSGVGNAALVDIDHRLPSDEVVLPCRGLSARRLEGRGGY
jgi:hypothetical protein